MVEKSCFFIFQTEIHIIVRLPMQKVTIKIISGIIQVKDFRLENCVYYRIFHKKVVYQAEIEIQCTVKLNILRTICFFSLRLLGTVK